MFGTESALKYVFSTKFVTKLDELYGTLFYGVPRDDIWETTHSRARHWRAS